MPVNDSTVGIIKMLTARLRYVDVNARKLRALIDSRLILILA